MQPQLPRQVGSHRILEPADTTGVRFFIWLHQSQPSLQGALVITDLKVCISGSGAGCSLREGDMRIGALPSPSQPRRAQSRVVISGGAVMPPQSSGAYGALPFPGTSASSVEIGPQQIPPHLVRPLEQSLPTPSQGHIQDSLQLTQQAGNSLPLTQTDESACSASSLTPSHSDFLSPTATTALGQTTAISPSLSDAGQQQLEPVHYDAELNMWVVMVPSTGSRHALFSSKFSVRKRGYAEARRRAVAAYQRFLQQHRAVAVGHTPACEEVHVKGSATVSHPSMFFSRAKEVGYVHAAGAVVAQRL